MLKVKDELLKSLSGYDTERLMKALEATEASELDSYLPEETLEEAVERLEFLKARDLSEKLLLEAIGQHNKEDLQLKLEDARRKRVAAIVLDQGSTRVAE